MLQAQMLEFEGQLEEARKAYCRLALATDHPQAPWIPRSGLLHFVRLSAALGQAERALAFVRRQTMYGVELATARLQASLGNGDGAALTLRKYLDTSPVLEDSLPGPYQQWLAMRAALARDDAPATAAAWSKRRFDYDSSPMMLAQAQLRLGDHAAAEHSLYSQLRRSARAYTGRSLHLGEPLTRFLCHYHLGKVCEAAGKREQARDEYRRFLRPFEGKREPLPEIAEARAALRRLEGK